LCDDFNRGGFTPLLEADIAGYLYHLLLKRKLAPVNVYLDTRIKTLKKKKQKRHYYDLVIGKLNQEDAFVKPDLICQIKAFQRWGLTHQQMRRRLELISKSDIPSMKSASKVLKNGRVQIIVDLFDKDLHGFLEGNQKGHKRIDTLKEKYSKMKIPLIWIHPNEDGDLGFNVFGRKP